MHVEQMIATHPKPAGSSGGVLTRCIEACYDCAQTCTSCADACLGEEMVAELRQCIRFNLDCANVCATTGAVASRRTGDNATVLRRLLEACAEACGACGAECHRHASRMEHCRVCAEACERCAEACHAALAHPGVVH